MSEIDREEKPAPCENCAPLFQEIFTRLAELEIKQEKATINVSKSHSIFYK